MDCKWRNMPCKLTLLSTGTSHEQPSELCYTLQAGRMRISRTKSFWQPSPSQLQDGVERNQSVPMQAHIGLLWGCLYGTVDALVSLEKNHNLAEEGLKQKTRCHPWLLESYLCGELKEGMRVSAGKDRRKKRDFSCTEKYK